MHRPIHLLSAALIVGTLIALPLRAEDAPREDAAASRAAAERLMDLFNTEDSYRQTMQQVAQMPMRMLESQDMSEEQKAEARRAMQASMDATLKRFSWARIKPMFVDVYAEVFTPEEIQGLIDFYESPLGRAFLAKQPQLTAATMERMQDMMQEIMPELQRDVEEALRESGVEAHGGH